MTIKFHCGKWDEDSVFVFGSNLAGRHGLGAIVSKIWSNKREA